MSIPIELAIATFIASMVRVAVPILYVALGEMWAERSGVLNIGVEGVMLIGAFLGFAGLYFTRNPFVAIALGIVGGLVFGLMKSLFSIKFGLDQIITGIGIWFLCLGVAAFMFRTMLPHKAVTKLAWAIEPVPIPLLSQVPFIGSGFFNLTIFGYVAIFLLAPASYIFLYKTPFGLKVRSVGENPEVADSLGVNVFRVRYACVIYGSILASLGGVYMSTAFLNNYSDGMTAGIGFLSIAIVMLGRWDPGKIVGGAFIYGAAFALQYRLQGLEILTIYLPIQVFVMLPYLLTIIVIVIVARKGGLPAALCVSYIKAKKARIRA